jgi:hypothetical protein
MHLATLEKNWRSGYEEDFKNILKIVYIFNH